MRKRMRLYLLVIGYFAFQALPYFMLPRYGEVAERINFAGRSWEIDLAWGLWPFVLLLEGGAALFVCGLCKALFRAARYRWALRIAAGTLSLTVVGLIAIYYAALFSSWSFFQLTGAFLSFESIKIAVLAADIKSMSFTAGRADQTLLLAGPLGGLLVAALIYALARPLTRRQEIQRFLLQLLPALVIVVGLGVFTRLMLSAEGFSTLLPVLDSNISPQMSLYVRRIAYGPTQKSFDSVDLTLQPAYSIADYARLHRQELKRKNVVLIMLEALRSDVLFAPNQSATVMPKLEALARAGYYFPNTYAQAPETDYSQVSILTGQFPLRSPGRDLYFNQDYPKAKIYELAHAFGYRTALITEEWQQMRRITGSPALSLHFDPALDAPALVQDYLSEQDRPKDFRNMSTARHDRYRIEVAKNWIAETKSLQQPFMLTLFLFSSHFPYDNLLEMGSLPFVAPAPPYSPHFFGYAPELASILRPRYLNALFYLDTLIGELTAYLEMLGLSEETVLLITGDHGELFGEHGRVTHGGELYEEALKVPLVIAGANDLVPVRAAALPARHVDIAPTILKVLGLPEYAGFQGRSLLDKTASHDAAPTVFSTVQTYLFQDMLVQWPYKLIKDLRTGAEALFNLQSDPTERQDLRAVDLAAAAQLRKKLKCFRDVQLSYYLGSAERRRNTFPPQLEDQLSAAGCD